MHEQMTDFAEWPVSRGHDGKAAEYSGIADGIVAFRPRKPPFLEVDPHPSAKSSFIRASTRRIAAVMAWVSPAGSMLILRPSLVLKKIMSTRENFKPPSVEGMRTISMPATSIQAT